MANFEIHIPDRHFDRRFTKLVLKQELEELFADADIDDAIVVIQGYDGDQ